ncbi:OmpA family protein [Vibrio profundum]|uniref:OmpA family protein n=1 Tax=Vibrio profundum TaxID=2910247 RepID=UPI003D14E1F2
MMGRVYDNEFYLLGAQFHATEDSGGNKSFDLWNQQNDLTLEKQLVGKVRPIPFTPVMVNALSGAKDKYLWGTNIEGKLMELGLAQPSDERLVKKQGQSPSSADPMVLHHSSRVETIQPGVNYELSFPPLNLLAQMIGDGGENGGAADVETLADNLRDFATTVEPSLSGAQFVMTQVLPSQLAPAYQALAGEQLDTEQIAYNEWRENKLKMPDKPIKGFMLPRMHACLVVFSDPLYAGSEVSLVRPLQDVSPGGTHDSGEEVLATIVVGTHKKLMDDGAHIEGLPSAFFSFDPTQVGDGFYLVRVQFWEKEYEQFHQQDGLKLPESVKQAHVEKAYVAKNSGEQPQNLYTYELHEKLVFQDSPGVGKMACVCGDMLTLEELIIQQFPSRLPAYSDFVTQGLTKQVKGEPGLAVFSLVDTVNSAYGSLKQKALSNQLQCGGSAGDIAKTIGAALWDATDKAYVPDFIMKGMAIAPALAVRQEALATYNKAKILARRNITWAQSSKLVFRHYVMDDSYLKRMYTIGRDANEATEVSLERAFGHISSSWESGALLERGLPAMETYLSIKEAHGEYKAQQKEVDSADNVFAQLEVLVASYLEEIVFVNKYDDKDKWKNKAKLLQDQLGQDAHIAVDQRGIAIQLNFQFNSAHLENEVQPLNSDCREICENLKKLLEDHPYYQVVIEGHAGVIGTEEANIKVSKARAEHIKNLILDPDGNVGNEAEQEELSQRLNVKYFGKSQLLRGKESNYHDTHDRSDSADIAVDRRVVIRLLIPEFSLSLPPSRTGSAKLEKLHLLWQAHLVAAEEHETELIKELCQALVSVALFTPLAPYAAWYLIAESDLAILDTAAELYDSTLGGGVYHAFKQQLTSKDGIHTLAKINREILKKYKNVNQPIQTETIEPDQLANYLKSSSNKKELMKRFLLRAYALNSLIELLAIISSEKKLFQTLGDLVEAYHVNDFIQRYLMSDNWDLTFYEGNTLAVNWVNRYKQTAGSLAYMASRGVSFDFSDKVSGAFCTGFPVQSALYLDKPKDQDTGGTPSVVNNALEQFCRDFDFTPKKISDNDIGFCRLLVFDTETDQWLTYDKWMEHSLSLYVPWRGRLGPQDRVKIQVVLTEKATKNCKSVFVHDLSYLATGAVFDTYGPTFKVMFTHVSQDHFTDPDGYIKSYFDGQGKGGATDILSGMEFEPTFCFGSYQMHGLKPLCSASWLDEIAAVIYGESKFEYWVVSNFQQSMIYEMRLGSVPLSVRYPYSPIKVGQRLEKHIKNWVSIEDRLISYGVFDKTTETHSYSGQYLYRTHLNDSDFLVEDFVMSQASERKDNTPSILSGNMFSVAGLKIGDEFKMASEWSIQALTDHFSWQEEQDFSVYIAVLGDETARDDYAAMAMDGDCCPVTFQFCEDGVISHTDMYYGGALALTKSETYSESSSGYNGMSMSPSYTLAHEESDGTQLSKYGLSDFIGAAVREIEQKSADYNSVLKHSSEKHIYVMKCDLSYMAPNGSPVQGLRPFGDIIDSNGHIKGMDLSISQLSQSNVNSTFPVPELALSLPPSGAFDSLTMPWCRDINESEAKNLSAYHYWSTLDAKQKSAWLKKWIEDDKTSTQAPSVELLQV